LRPAHAQLLWAVYALVGALLGALDGALLGALVGALLGALVGAFVPVVVSGVNMLVAVEYSYGSPHVRGTVTPASRIQAAVVDELKSLFL